MKAGVGIRIDLRNLLTYLRHDDQMYRLRQTNDIRLQHLSAGVGYVEQHIMSLKFGQVAFGKCGKSRLQPTFYPFIIHHTGAFSYLIQDIDYGQLD